MRVDKSDLDDSVVEDGETPTILITDGKTLTAKNKDMHKSSHPLNGVHVPISCKLPSKHPSQQNGVVSMPKKQREPVEDCEEEEEEARETSADSVLDSLTHSMKGVSIQETASVELEGRLASLTVNDDGKEEGEEEGEDTRCASLQSQSSVITVDPPSLPHEEEEERSEVTEDLAPRGPTSGKPTSYRPNQSDFNHIAGKAYSSHNLDRFHGQMAPFVAPQPPLGPTNGSYPLTEFAQNGFYPSPAYGRSEMGGGVVVGKRGMEEEEETPFKYTRPVEEMGFEAPPAGVLAECQQVRKSRSLFSQVSVDLSCGGNMVDTSLSPEEELAQTIKPAGPGAGNPGYETQLSFSDLETFLQLEQVDGSTRDHDPGYISENSPHSVNTGSPGSSPKSVFSPPVRPPSCMSQDSGIASPFSEDNLSTIMPSPPEDSSSQKLTDTTQAALYKSPPSGTVYQSPPSRIVYQSPPSGTVYQSPPGGTVYQSPPSGTVYQSPPSGTVYQSPSSRTVYQSPPSGTVYQSPPSGTVYQSPPSVTLYQNPPSVASVMSPYSVAGSDELSLTSASSPVGHWDSQNDYFFNTHKDQLRDALDVIAQDMKSTQQHKKDDQQATSPQKGTGGAVVVPATPGNLPVSVTQQKSGRPEKLPIAPLQKAVRPAAAGGGQQQQQASVMKGALPVMIVPSTMGGASTPTTTAAAPVTSMVLMNSGQNSQMILVVNPNQPAAAQTPKKKILPKLLPRPGPVISDSAPRPMGAKVATPADMVGAAKGEPTVGSCEAGKVGVSGVRAGPAVQSGPGPQPPGVGKKTAQGRNPPQSKMLNIARRLVASMTTSDLQFQDSEGDTYLHVSVCKADKNMVQALLERLFRENLHVMINIQNLMRQTPLYLAVSANSPEMVDLLIQYGADVNVCAQHIHADGISKEVKAALHCAASKGHGHLPTLQALLAARDLNIDIVNSDGHTALHCAILEHGKADSEGGVINNLPIIQALIRHGADPNAQGKKSGKTALMYALESRDLDLIKHIVALIDPARLRIYLKTQAFDGSTCQRIVEKLQQSLNDSGRQRLHACFRFNSK